MQLSEIELVRAIRKVLSGEAPGVVVAVGDDAAVVEPTSNQGLLTVDMLVDGVHFEAGVTSAHDLGYKAVAVNVSDVAAMGGSPRYGLACVGIPPDVEAAWIVELYGGMREAADEHAMALIGGDTSRADRITVSVTVSGEVPSGRAVTRAGAQPGDALVVTGSLGASAGGLRLAQASAEDEREGLSTEWGRALVARHERPVARVGEGQALAAAGATAMIDVSDGLAIDLWRVCEESEVGARVAVADVPVADGLEELGRLLRVDPLDLALHGGEDYELLASLPAAAVEEARQRLLAFGTSLTRIGEVTGDRTILATWPDGEERPLEPVGWDHFGRR